MTHSSVSISFLHFLTAKPTLYVLMPLLLLIGIVLLIKPQLLTSRTSLSSSAGRTIAILLTVLGILYFAFVIWLSVSFGRGPEAR